MFNLIESYIVVLIFVVNTSAAHNSKDGLFNVGTVLFTNNDLNKKRWSRTNIEVLQARRYFQNIIPSPSMKSLDENYVNNLIKYFTNTFKTLKREAIDPGLAEVMEAALSDVIGGYFKVWVLPVTKLTYYGGAVSQDNAVKIFQFYEKLKRSLNTDGSRWRKPSDIILNTIAIRVIPSSHEPHTRSMKYPCEHLAYFEQSDAGLSIPTPLINWNEPPCSMFLPLKNESLIQLDSPSASKSLMKYYDIAKGCCQSKSPDTCNDFDLRFQDWISNNVVPHISDDKLYVAFGSLLSLMNKTNDLIENSSNMCEYEYDKLTIKSILSKLPPCMTSHKFFILISILILEIIWCVPAMIYIICSRRKSKMKQQTQLFLDICKRRRYHTVGRIDKSEERNHIINKKDLNDLNQKIQSRILEHGVKLVQKPRERNKEVVTQYPSHYLRRSAGQVTSDFAHINNNQECQCELVTLINEKITKDAARSSLIKLTDCKDMTNPNQTESFSEVHKFKTTFTKIIRDKSRSNSISCVACPSSNKAIKKMKSETKEKLKKIQNVVNDSICPCTCCIEQDRKQIEEAKRTSRLKESRDVKLRTNAGGTARSRNVTDEINKTKLPKLQPRVCGSKNVKLNKTKGLKINTGEPLLEIRIDRPAAEITVDITKTCRKNVRPSKIPRLATAANAKGESKLDSTRSVQQATNTMKKRTMDDSEVKRQVVKHNKLNMTV